VPEAAEPGDPALVTASRDSDEAPFFRIVDEWSLGMSRLARGHVPSDASAEEVVQDAWLGAFSGSAHRSVRT